MKARVIDDLNKIWRISTDRGVLHCERSRCETPTGPGVEKDWAECLTKLWGNAGIDSGGLFLCQVVFVMSISVGIVKKQVAKIVHCGEPKISSK